MGLNGTNSGIFGPRPTSRRSVLEFGLVRSCELSIGRHGNAQVRQVNALPCWNLADFLDFYPRVVVAGAGAYRIDVVRGEGVRGPGVFGGAAPEAFGHGGDAVGDFIGDGEGGDDGAEGVVDADLVARMEAATDCFGGGKR